MAVLALPDDVMLHVLGFLYNNSLLPVRQVCRRWRELALHPALWRRRSLRLHHGRLMSREATSASVTALRVAPCVETLTVEPHYLHRLCLLLCAATRCAAASLELRTLGASDLALAAVVTARQAELGRLRRVAVRLENAACQSDLAHVLLRQVCDLQGLVELSVDAADEFDVTALAQSAPVSPAPGPASLRKLEFGVPVNPYLPLLLAKHGATLTTLAVSNYNGLGKLVVGLPRLEKLTCCLLDDMLSLRECGSLVDLAVTVRTTKTVKNELQLVADLDSYLRASAPRLKRVTLEFQANESRPEVVMLVLALAGNRRSSTPAALEELMLDFHLDDTRIYDDELPPLQMAPLAAVLHHFPRLRVLDMVGMTSSALLDTIDPDALPALRVLKTRPPALSSCSHEWLHGAEVQGVFERNPKLHMILRSYFEDCDCSYCKDHDTCHKVPWEDEFLTVGVVTHLPEAECEVVHSELQSMYNIDTWLKY